MKPSDIIILLGAAALGYWFFSGQKSKTMQANLLASLAGQQVTLENGNVLDTGNGVIFDAATGRYINAVTGQIIY